MDRCEAALVSYSVFGNRVETCMKDKGHTDYTHETEGGDTWARLIDISTKCPVCGMSSSVTIPIEGHSKWLNGILIKEALPGLSESERVKLVTGTCDKCWETMFERE